MHKTAYPPIEETKPLLQSWNVEGTSGVVEPATFVGRSVTSQLRILLGRVSFAAPLGARYPEQIHEITFPPVNTISHYSPVCLTIAYCFVLCTFCFSLGSMTIKKHGFLHAHNIGECFRLTTTNFNSKQTKNDVTV